MAYLISILAFIVGFIIGKVKFKKVNPTEPEGRKCLYETELSQKDGNKFSITAEMVEIDNDGNGNTKLLAIDVRSSQSAKNDTETIKAIKTVIEGWRPEKDVVWFNNTSKVRNNKIDSILK